MRFAGQVFKTGRFWAIEVPILSVASQGRTKREAYAMIADAIELLVDKPDFSVHLFPGKGDYFEIGSSDDAVLTAFLLRRERTKSGLTLAEVARRLGSKSQNAYARYEQGRSVPTVSQLSRLLSAVAARKEYVLTESQT
jgi:hypothetical protein